MGRGGGGGGGWWRGGLGPAGEGMQGGYCTCIERTPSIKQTLKHSLGVST